MRLKGLMRDRTFWFPLWNCPLKFSGALFSQLLPTALPSPPSCSSLIWDESRGFNAGWSWWWPGSCPAVWAFSVAGDRGHPCTWPVLWFIVWFLPTSFYLLRNFITTVNLHKVLEGVLRTIPGTSSKSGSELYLSPCIIIGFVVFVFLRQTYIQR